MSQTKVEQWMREAAQQIHSELDAACCDGWCETKKAALALIIAAHAPTPAPSQEIEDVAFRNQNRLWLAENKLLEMNIEWQDGRGYVYNGKD